MKVRNNGGNIAYVDPETSQTAFLRNGEDGDIPDGVYWEHHGQLEVINQDAAPPAEGPVDASEDVDENGERHENPEPAETSSQPAEALVAPHGLDKMPKAQVVEWLIEHDGGLESDYNAKTKHDLIDLVHKRVKAANKAHH